MDVIYLLKDVKNLNEYITITQCVLDKCKNGKNIKVTNNIETALTLKKVRSLEIEYFIKCDENGAACIVFEHLLNTPPSTVWRVSAEGLIFSLHYWLDTVRKHWINHNAHWWRFLKVILKFITEISTKNPAIPNMLVEITSECLFELATTANVFQQHTILHCFNSVCDKSGREVRCAMRTKFGDYFVKIAAHMAKSGYFHHQYSLLECLMRWLVSRDEPAVRAAAAEKWLPHGLCPPAATALFINRSWKKCFQDARDFLNAVNEGNGLGTSVVCRRVSIGKDVIINGTERRPSWLDFNTAGKSVSVLVDPRVLQAFDVPNNIGYQSLLIENEFTDSALLLRGYHGVTIAIRTVRAPSVLPCDVHTGNARLFSAVISSRTDLNTLDGAMRNIFGDKYHRCVGIHSVISQSPQMSYSSEKGSEEDTRFLNPDEVTRRRECGYENRTRTPSPSSVSTLPIYHSDNLVDLILDQEAFEAQSKFCSSKDNAIDDEIHANKIDDVPLSEIKTRNINKSSKTTATCYKELKKERKTYNIRSPKIRKSKTNVIHSPKTLKKNTMVDNLKHKLENTECNKLVDKNSNVYDFASDSKDEDYKKKKIDTIKNINESTNSLNSTTKEKNLRRAKETGSSNKKPKKIIKRKKNVKTCKKVKKLTKQKADGENAVSSVKVSEVLDDERLREVVREELDTSILIHHPINLEPEGKESVITEVIYDSISNDTLKSKKAKQTQMAIHVEQSNDTTTPKKIANKREKTTELLSITKEKGLALKYKTTTASDKENEGTISPLPELVVETMNKDREDIDGSSAIKMLQKFKIIYEDDSDPDNDTVTTQNVLSDVDRFNFTGQNCDNITEEVCLEDVSKENMNTKATANKKGKEIEQLKTLETRSQEKIETIKYDIIEIEGFAVNDNQVDKSILSCDITAHGNSDEDPLNPDSIYEDFQPREIQDLDPSLKDFFNKLSKEIHNPPDAESITYEDEEVRNILSNPSPVVSENRLQFESISKYMPSPRSSDPNCPPSSPQKKITKTTTKTSKIRSDLKKLSTSTPNQKTLHNKRRTDSIISPTVSVKRLSVEDIDKGPSSTIPKKITPSKLSELQFTSILKPVATKSINSPGFEPQKEESTDNNSSRNAKRCSPMASKSPLRGLKRKSSSPIRNDANLMRIDDPKQKVDIVSDSSVNLSHQSISSVSDWLEQAGPSGCTENHDSISVKDVLQNIMAILDTTLVEINYNTSKNFVDLLVGWQKQLNDQKKKRAEDDKITEDMLKNVQEKINDIRRKCETADNNLLNSIKQQAINLLRDNEKKINIMMQHLRDEVQAAINCLERTNSP